MRHAEYQACMGDSGGDNVWMGRRGSEAMPVPMVYTWALCMHAVPQPDVHGGPVSELPGGCLAGAGAGDGAVVHVGVGAGMVYGVRRGMILATFRSGSGAAARAGAGAQINFALALHYGGGAVDAAGEGSGGCKRQWRRRQRRPCGGSGASASALADSI